MRSFFIQNLKVTAVACNYLAWIYKKEGDEEQSHLWYLKAL